MSGVLQLDAHDTAVGPLCASTPCILTGKQAILALSGELELLAERSGQPGAMHGLTFLLEQKYAARKIPHLVCFRTASGELAGAVLLFEYRWAGWPTRMMATGDRFGVRTVLGADGLRPWLARQASSAMLRRGAKAVLVSFKWAGQLDARAEPGALSRPWALQTRLVRDTFSLASSLDATFARLGKRTRTHLRYYRRRAQNALSCVYVTDAAGLLDLDDAALLTRFNAASLDPVTQRDFNLQLRTAAAPPGGFISGLRSGDGKWLALVGGWRQAGTTWVQWQANASGYEELSLGTALRAFLIEDEVARGTTRLAFHGGTSHSMSHAFDVDQVVDMLVIRPGYVARSLARLAPWLYRRLPTLASRGNLLGDVLSSEHLRWLSEEQLTSSFGTTDVEP